MLNWRFWNRERQPDDDVFGAGNEYDPALLDLEDMENAEAERRREEADARALEDAEAFTRQVGDGNFSLGIIGERETVDLRRRMRGGETGIERLERETMQFEDDWSALLRDHEALMGRIERTERDLMQMEDSEVAIVREYEREYEAWRRRGEWLDMQFEDRQAALMREYIARMREFEDENEGGKEDCENGVGAGGLCVVQYRPRLRF